MSKVFVFVLGLFLVVSQSSSADPEWTAEFDPPWSSVSLGLNEKFILTIRDLELTAKTKVSLFSSNPDVASLSSDTVLKQIRGGALNGTFEVVPVGIGEAYIFVEIVRNRTEVSSQSMKVMVQRNRAPTMAARIVRYLHSPDLSWYFFLFLFFNFGIILNVGSVMSIMKKPIAVFLAFLLIFLLVPVTTFVLEFISHRNDVDKLFDTLTNGINVLTLAYIANSWTVLLRGNFDLSVSISAITGFLCFVLAALVNYIGQTVYETPGSNDHYAELEWSVFRQLVPLLIGLLVQQCFPRAKTVSSIALQWFLTPFAIVRFSLRILTTEWDLVAYNLVTLNSVLAGFGLTFGVNALALLSSFLFRLKLEDCSTVAIEAVTKVLPLVEYLKSEYTRKEGDLFDLLYVTTILSIPVVLLSHLIFKIIREKLQIKNQGIERI